jgi:hypothetical protein
VEVLLCMLRYDTFPGGARIESRDIWLTLTVMVSEGLG